MAVLPLPESATEWPNTNRRACGDQFGLLLPHPARALEHPRGARIIIVKRPTHKGGISVAGERDGTPLIRVTDGARTDQLCLLGPLATRIA